ncbi:DUF2752 domain-containing protein [Sinomicrobium sp. FJxs]|uniref:DUF2752 domain-containing protein n=2 Tax=Sinomicrobium weinanense TaxID=2842200 RepID=A0A926JU19_9FLAO|nr:DUF2752 domain-containing protein [Sinomicrobium weinanense]MBU3123398.1 DUF2752 domain-containing protein [Sinomicrobium weinanense]
MLPCINKQLFGFECPGCGLQRAAALLFKGDFAGAFEMYPAIYPLCFLFVFLFLDVLWKKRNFSGITAGLATISTVFILCNYILKFL